MALVGNTGDDPAPSSLCIEAHTGGGHAGANIHGGTTIYQYATTH
ncbi:MAG: hypothetical protein ACE5I2_11660 [Anaerolineae bacterium]